MLLLQGLELLLVFLIQLLHPGIISVLLGKFLPFLQLLLLHLLPLLVLLAMELLKLLLMTGIEIAVAAIRITDTGRGAAWAC